MDNVIINDKFRKKISIVNPCFNEEENVELMVRAVKEIMEKLPYEYEHILVDNHSDDRTWDILKRLAGEDKRIKIIRNVRNFGGLRNAANGLFQADGDCAILLACDFQDPPELIPQFIEKWNQGYKVVLGKKTESDENALMYNIRGLYYKIIQHYSEVPEYEQTTGFGLYDQTVISQLKALDEPEPSLRHLIADLGYQVAFIEFRQPKRLRGKSGYSLRYYFQYAVSSFINTSKVPLKLAILWGFIVSLISFAVAIFYLVWKLKNWMYFDMGQAPLLIGIFFIGGILLMFLGILGEYIGEILTRVTKRPLVIEEERLNFEDKSESIVK